MTRICLKDLIYFFWNSYSLHVYDKYRKNCQIIQLTITVAEDKTPETPSPSPSTPTKKKPSKKKKTPYTGDASVAAPLGVLLAGMTTVMTSLGITKRRKNK